MVKKVIKQDMQGNVEVEYVLTESEYLILSAIVEKYERLKDHILGEEKVENNYSVLGEK